MLQDRIWLLLSRKIDGEATMDELRELEQLLINQPEDACKIDIVTSYLLKEHKSETLDDEETQAWEKHIASMHSLYPEEFKRGSEEILLSHRPSIISRLQRHRGIVFSLLFIVVFTLGWLLYQKQANRSSANNNNGAQLLTQNNLPHPSKTKTVLPDGTQVWLNGNSHISYQEDFGRNNKREVDLIGEAFFDVT